MIFIQQTNEKEIKITISDETFGSFATNLKPNEEGFETAEKIISVLNNWVSRNKKSSEQYIVHSLEQGWL